MPLVTRTAEPKRDRGADRFSPPGRGKAAGLRPKVIMTITKM